MSSGIDMAVFISTGYNHGYTVVNHHFRILVAQQTKSLNIDVHFLLFQNYYGHSFHECVIEDTHVFHQDKFFRSKPAMSLLLAVAVAVFLLNLPFGFWRSGVRKLSFPWFLAVHLPIPFIVIMRLVSGMGFHLSTLPVMLGAYFAGQFAGGAMRRKRPIET